MKYSKEIKVGLSLILSAVIFVLGIRFFEDLPLFRGTYGLYTTFEDASGILPGNAVRINGVRVGSVDEVTLDPAAHRVLVRFHVDEHIAVPESSFTEIGGIAALASVHLRIHLGPATNARIEEGGYVPSLREANLLGQLTDKAPEMVEQIDQILATTNATLTDAQRLFAATSDEDVRRTLVAFRSSAETLDALLRAEQARLSGTLANFERFSDDLTVVAGDLRAISDESGDTLALAIRNLNQSMRRMDRTLEGLETSMATLDDILGKIDRGEGTLGRMINDPSVYVRLESTLARLDTILVHFDEDPGRFLKELELVDIF